MRFSTLIVDPHQLHPPRSATLDLHRRLAALKVTGDQRNQLRIGLAVNRRRLDLGEPSAIVGRFKGAGSGVGFDFDLDDD